MINSVKVLDIELQYVLEDLSGLHGYAMVQALIRFAGKPLGHVTVPLNNGCCPATTVYQAIITQQGVALAKHMMLSALVSTQHHDRYSTTQVCKASRHTAGPWPLVTVAVCTRDRPAFLADCLASLPPLAYPCLRIAIARFAIWWLWRRNVRRLLLSLLRPWSFPRDLILAELVGSLRGLGRYPKARRTASAIAHAYATRAQDEEPGVTTAPIASPRPTAPLQTRQPHS